MAESTQEIVSVKATYRNPDLLVSKAVSVYMRFMHQFNKLERSESILSNISYQDRALLDRLAQLWSDDMPPTVVEMMNSQAGFMSPTTVHRRLKTLRKMGMVELRQNTDDNRCKFVTPTEKCIAYFDLMGTCIFESAAQE
jgi:DNA-binding transcriptional ArsR family regulator